MNALGSHGQRNINGGTPMFGVSRLNKNRTFLSSTMIPYTNNQSEWHNFDPQWEEWCKVESNLKRARLGRIGELGKDNSSSPTVPQTFEEYKEHKVEWQKMQEATFQRTLDFAVEEARVNRHLGLPKFDISEMPCENDGCGTVLGFPTVWTPVHMDGNLIREEAPWPSKEEFSEEGDERHTSHFSRFLPLPRYSGNKTVNWKQKPFMPAEPFDRVRPIPGNKVTYPGLLFDRSGRPYDDESQSGRTVYVEKNPFDEVAQLEYEMQKCDTNQQNSLLRSFRIGAFKRSITPPHPLANLNNSAAISSPHNVHDMKSIALIRRFGSATTGSPASSSRVLRKTPIPPASDIESFNYDPHVQEFVPEVVPSPSDMRSDKKKPVGATNSPTRSKPTRPEPEAEPFGYNDETFVSGN